MTFGNSKGKIRAGWIIAGLAGKPRGESALAQTWGLPSAGRGMVCCLFEIHCREMFVGLMTFLCSRSRFRDWAVREIMGLQVGLLRFERWCVELAKGAALRRYAVAGLLVFCCVADRSWAASRPRLGSSALAADVTSHFAIADFDGDHRADLATVQAGTESASQSRYWIRFELTSGNRQFFKVTGPAGGLRISPRDVNGDHALDLVVSTAWLNQTIAILLNDGHGNFTLADPSAFPDAAPDSQAGWSGQRTQTLDNAAIPRSWFKAKVCAVGASAFLAGDHAELRPIFAFRFRLTQPEFSWAGRAPPTRRSSRLNMPLKNA
jgi:hypothetical protein